MSQSSSGCVTVWLWLRHSLASVASPFGFGCVTVWLWLCFFVCLFFASQFGFDCVSLVLAVCLSVCLFISAFVFLCLFACFLSFLFLLLLLFSLRHRSALAASQCSFGCFSLIVAASQLGCVTVWIWLRHCLALAAVFCLISSRSRRRRILPLALLGICCRNSTPPLSCM